MSGRALRNAAARWSAVVLAAMALGGCGGDGMEDLRGYVEKIKTRPGGRVEPIPEVRPFEFFGYSDDGRPSPFAPWVDQPAASKFSRAAAGGLQPDLNRRKEPLESYPLDGLKLVGTLDRGKQKWALIAAPDKIVYRVTVGNHLGQADGRIVSIGEDKLTLMEIVPDGQGGWVERQAVLALAE